MQSLRPAFDTDPCFVTPVTQKVDLIFNVTSGESLILSWGDLGELRHGRCNALKANLPNVIELAIGGDHGNAVINSLFEASTLKNPLLGIEQAKQVNVVPN